MINFEETHPLKIDDKLLLFQIQQHLSNDKYLYENIKNGKNIIHYQSNLTDIIKPYTYYSSNNYNRKKSHSFFNTLRKSLLVY